jgi:hypothetical protein
MIYKNKMVKKIRCEKCNFEISAQNINKHKNKCNGSGPRKRNIGGDRLAWIRGKKMEDVFGFNKSQEIKEKIKRSLTEEKKFKLHTEESKLKISLSMSKNTNWKNSINKTGKGLKGYYKGDYFMSSWELAFMVFCELHNINIRRNWESFPYLDENGIRRNYIPDFYDAENNKFYEVKGYEPKFCFKIRDFLFELEVYDINRMKTVLSEIEELHGKDFYNKLKDSVSRGEN